MSGTYADQALLAVSSVFISQCKVAIIHRVVELNAGSDRLSIGMLNLVRNTLSDAGSYSERMAWLIAAGNPTIAAAAPTVPSEGDTQYAVNTMLPLLASQ